MHDVSGFISAFESPNSAQKQRRHPRSKFGPETILQFFAVVAEVTGSTPVDHRRHHRTPFSPSSAPFESWNIWQAQLVEIFDYACPDLSCSSL
jgi:hypothetical protein